MLLVKRRKRSTKSVLYGHLTWVVCCLQLWGFNCTATVYKCQDEQGVISYQQSECADSFETEVMEVSAVTTEEEREAQAAQNAQRRKDQRQEFRNRAALQEILSRREAISKIHGALMSGENKKEAQCNQLKEQYRSLSQSTVSACKKSRDVYCDQGAEKIEQQNKQIKQSFQMPPLQSIKERMKKLGCN